VIGLMFVAAIGLWLLFTAYLTVQVPRRLGLQGAAKWLARLLLVPLLLVGPLADHLIGMGQFERLCAEEGRLQISPAAANTKRAIGTSGDSEMLEGYAIPIERQIRRIIDLDSGEQIAQYKVFSTPGGVVGKLPEMGSRFTCSIKQPGHVDANAFDALATRTNLTYEKLK
jgi:hypothetical protein